ncbi:MAG: radical SAM protein [Acutalibacteraceae bacterium]|nr:radical SAM protein [Acutalibacteraceae bacterium]
MCANISIFVPHLGCKNLCSFCNQFHITSQQKAPTKEDVKNAIETGINSLKDKSCESEVAFFGGSFTAIDSDYMQDLLKTAFSYVERGLLKGIRISTRPDEIDESRLNILKKYGVTSIELGAQSMCDDVLQSNNRGHSSTDVFKASDLIKGYNFELGLQMMTGLYKSDDDKDIFTANEFVKIKPDTVRIYPTIILKNTYLQVLYNQNKYKPQSLDDAVNLCVKLIDIFNKNDIKIIRTGLHTIDINQYVAGPWHPAFGELCISRIYRNKIENKLTADSIIRCNKSDVSKIIGQKKENILYFNKLGFNVKIIEDVNVKKGQFEITEV